MIDNSNYRNAATVAVIVSCVAIGSLVTTVSLMYRRLSYTESVVMVKTQMLKVRTADG